MRIKIILENEAGLKKDSLWFLFDESSCAKVADLAYLIKKRLWISEGDVSLSLDGFSLPLQESIRIVDNNDEITARFVPQAPASPSETSSSESEYEFEQTKQIPSNVLSSAQKKKNVIPVQKTIVKKKKSVNTPSAVLKKVAQTIPKSLVQNVNILKKTAANVLTKTNPANKTSLSNNVSYKSSTKNVVPVRKVSSSSCDTSSSSSDEEHIKKVSVAKKKVPPNAKTHSAPAKKDATISVNKKTVLSSKKNDSSSSDEVEPVKKKAMLTKKVVTGNGQTKKAIPLSKLGVCRTTSKDTSTDSSDSSDSSDEGTPQLKSKVAPTISKRNAVSDRTMSNIKGGNSFVTVSNSKKSNTVTKASSSESSDESSTSSSDDGPEIIKKKANLSNTIPDKHFVGNKNNRTLTKNSNDKANAKKKQMDKLNTSVNSVGMSKVVNNKADSPAQPVNSKKSTKIVDFHVSMVSKDKDNITNNDFSHKSNNSDTTPTHHASTCNGNSGSSRAKRLLSKDVYKNQSQFVVNKPAAIDNLDTEPTKDKKSDDATCNSTDLNDSFVATAENVSGRVMRRRKRASIRKENKKKRQLAEAAHHDIGENQVEKQELACDDLKQERKNITEQAIKDQQLSENTGTSTGQSKCFKCGLRDTSYSQLQTGAYEPITTLVCCNKCGNRWKFKAHPEPATREKAHLQDLNNMSEKSHNAVVREKKEISLLEKVDSFISNVQNGSCDEMNASNTKIVDNDFIPGDTKEEIPEKIVPVTDYGSFESLAAPPAVGSRIAYKILEMNTVLYTPEISQYKEALIKSFNEENNTLELEVCQDPRQCKDKDDSQIGGRFEMPEMVDEENQGYDAQTNPIVKWNELLEPRLLV